MLGLKSHDKNRHSTMKSTALYMIDTLQDIDGQHKLTSTQSLQSAFLEFKKRKQKKVQQNLKYQAKNHTSNITTAAQRGILRQKFVDQALKYQGIPYARKYWPPDSPEFQAPLFLDCCHLVRRVLRDLADDLGFQIGPWNQAYMFDTLPVEVSEDDIEPGDLVFVSATYNNHKAKKQRHNMVHVEILLGDRAKTIGARWQKGKVQIFDNYMFDAKSYHTPTYHFRSIDTWLQGICRSYCSEHPWRVPTPRVFDKRSIFCLTDHPADAFHQQQFVNAESLDGDICDSDVHHSNNSDDDFCCSNAPDNNSSCNVIDDKTSDNVSACEIQHILQRIIPNLYVHDSIKSRSDIQHSKNADDNIHDNNISTNDAHHDNKSGCDIHHSNMTDCDILHSNTTDCDILPSIHPVIDLCHSNRPDCDIYHSNITVCDISPSNSLECDISPSNSPDCGIHHSNTSDCIAHHSDTSDCIARHSNTSDCIARHSNTSDCIAHQSSTSDCDIQNSNFPDCDVHHDNIHKCDIYHSNDSTCGHHDNQTKDTSISDDTKLHSTTISSNCKLECVLGYVNIDSYSKDKADCKHLMDISLFPCGHHHHSMSSFNLSNINSTFAEGYNIIQPDNYNCINYDMKTDAVPNRHMDTEKGRKHGFFEEEFQALKSINILPFDQNTGLISKSVAISDNGHSTDLMHIDSPNIETECRYSKTTSNIDKLQACQSLQKESIFEEYKQVPCEFLDHKNSVTACDTFSEEELCQPLKSDYGNQETDNELWQSLTSDHCNQETDYKLCQSLNSSSGNQETNNELCQLLRSDYVNQATDIPLCQTLERSSGNQETDDAFSHSLKSHSGKETDDEFCQSFMSDFSNHETDDAVCQLLNSNSRNQMTDNESCQFLQQLECCEPITCSQPSHWLTDGETCHPSALNYNELCCCGCEIDPALPCEAGEQNDSDTATGHSSTWSSGHSVTQNSPGPGGDGGQDSRNADGGQSGRAGDGNVSGRPGGDAARNAGTVYAPNMQPTFYVGGGNGVSLVETPLLALGWKRILDGQNTNYRLKWVECKGKVNYTAFREGEQMVNHIPNCELLTNKMGLLNTLREYERVTITTKGRPPRLKLTDFLPETYRMDDRNERETFLNVYKDGETWISKPAGSNQGKGIYLLRSRDEITQMLCDIDQQLSVQPSRNRRSRTRPVRRIVQRYIKQPLLLDGRKFDIRSYMLIASTSPAYLVTYHKGYVRLSCHQYNSEDPDLTTHLTNQYIQKKDPSYKEVKEDTAWSMNKMNDYINESVAKERGLPKDWVNSTLKRQMEKISLHCFHAVRHKLQRKVGYFDLYGLDFMVDQDMKVSLIEVNVNPALHTNCDALKDVIPGVVTESLALSIECFEKNRRHQPLMPLKSLQGFSVLYCDSKSDSKQSPSQNRRQLSPATNDRSPATNRHTVKGLYTGSNLPLIRKPAQSATACPTTAASCVAVSSSVVNTVASNRTLSASVQPTAKLSSVAASSSASSSVLPPLPDNDSGVLLRMTHAEVMRTEHRSKVKNKAFPDRGN